MSDQLLLSVAFALGFSGFGLFVVFGAYRRWKWLVDPPTFLWFCYTQSFFKLIAGVEGCRVISVLLGIVLFGVGMNLLFGLLAGGNWL